MKIRRICISVVFFLFLFFPVFSCQPNEVLYVNANISENGEGNGINTFSTLSQALYFVEKHADLKNGNLTIILQSDIFEPDIILISFPIIIRGEKKSCIRFGKNAGFIMEGATLTMQNCEIVRAERKREPRNVPLVYASNSTVCFQNVVLHAQEGYSLLRLYDSIFSTQDSVIKMQAAYLVDVCTLVRSNVRFSQTDFSVQAEAADLFIVEDTDLYFDTVSSVMQLAYQGCGITAKCSKVQGNNFQLFCSPKDLPNRGFVPFRIDAESSFLFDEQSSFDGFFRCFSTRFVLLLKNALRIRD